MPICYTTPALTLAEYAQAAKLYHGLGDTPGGVAGLEHCAQVISHSGTTILGPFCQDQDAEDLLGAMVTIHILPNMTYGGRPYALIENVISAPNLRGSGAGRHVMRSAIDLASDARCYKIMLQTGRKREARGFYQKLGFDADEKWGMILRLP